MKLFKGGLVRKFMNQLSESRIWIWSASNMGPCIFKILEAEKYEIAGFIDNSEKLQNSVVCGMKVWRPEDAYLEIKDGDAIILGCTSSNNKSIREQLKINRIENNIYDWNPNIVSSDGGVNIYNPEYMTEGNEDKCVSKCCCQDDFERDYFKRIQKELGWKETRYHRKIWEFVFIADVLEKNGMLREGKNGLGFAVGEEPLPSYFASKGVNILATDLGIGEETADIWAQTGQNARGDISRLYKKDILSKETFISKVKYMDLDMNHIPNEIGQYDFCWSSCAIEHVGGLNLSKEFMKNMIKVLKPGGIAVHTTEFNLWSNDETIEEGFSVIWRKRDFEEIQEWMLKNGCEMTLSFVRSQKDADTYLPLPPYDENDERNHLNLLVGSYASTSYGLIIKKNAEGNI